MKFNWKSIVAAVAGGSLALIPTKKDVQAKTNDSLEITHILSIEIVGSNGVPIKQFVEVNQKISHTDHLEASVWITKSIHGCLKNKTRPNGNEFFTVAERYLRSKQLDVMRDPSEIVNVKDAMKQALKWFSQNQHLNSQDFKTAFATSELAIANASIERY